MERVRHACWTLGATWLLFLGTGLQVAGLSLDPRGLAALWPPFWLGVLLLALLRRRDDPVLARLTVFVETLFLIWSFGLAAAVTGYVLAGATSGYVDAMLAGADARLGFDWSGLYRWWSTTPTVQAVLRPAYKLIAVMPLVTLAALAFTGRQERAWTFVLAFALALVTVNALFPLFPAKSALLHHIGDGTAYTPAVAVAHADIIEDLRAGLRSSVDLQHMWGLITFPSFHAASAFLFAWAAWPVRWLRWPAAILNGAMLLATPIEGTHYLVDVIAGSIVAALSIAVAVRLGGARKVAAASSPVLAAA